MRQTSDTAVATLAHPYDHSLVSFCGVVAKKNKLDSHSHAPINCACVPSLFTFVSLCGFGVLTCIRLSCRGLICEHLALDRVFGAENETIVDRLSWDTHKGKRDCVNDTVIVSADSE